MSDVQEITIAHADSLHRAVNLPTLAAAIREDDDGGVMTFVGFADLDSIQAEHIAATILKELLAEILATNHPCPSCEERMERLTAALSALEGHKESAAPAPEARH